jgi:hypothetical protein
MEFFEGLLPYEIVLLIMGGILFAVLLFMLIYFVINKRSYMGILPFFIIAIIMVGFPSIQKIKIDNGIIEIEKLSKTVEQNPADTEAKRKLEIKLKEVGDRQISTSRNLKILEKASIAVGNDQMAVDYRNKLIRIQR